VFYQLRRDIDIDKSRPRPSKTMHIRDENYRKRNHYAGRRKHEDDNDLKQVLTTSRKLYLGPGWNRTRLKEGYNSKEWVAASK